MTAFTPATVAFLKGLGANNSKPWFDAHRADYDAHYIAPAKAFIEAVAEPLARIAPGIRAEPRVNGSIFRINRDIRFSRDKTPYKDHLDLWFWEGDKKTARSSFFFRLTADSLILGCGNHGFDKTGLQKFRTAVHSPASPAAQIVTAFENAGLTVNGAHYARLPRGFEAADADAERLLRFNALSVMQETAHPQELFSGTFAEWCAERWKPMAPLHRWLIETL